MKKTSFFNSLPFKLLVAVILGIVAGLILNRYSTNGISMAVLNITVTIKYILGQLITFCVPLIVLGFIAPSITRLGKNASLMLGVAVVLAYGSSVGAALFSTASGFLIIPHLSIHSYAAGLKRLPEVIFELEIPQIMSVMSALVFAMMLGLIEEIFQRNVIMESEKKQELVIDGNSFYEIDLKCLKEKKQKQEEAEKRQQKRQRK